MHLGYALIRILNKLGAGSTRRTEVTGILTKVEGIGTQSMSPRPHSTALRPRSTVSEQNRWLPDRSQRQPRNQLNIIRRTLPPSPVADKKNESSIRFASQWSFHYCLAACCEQAQYFHAIQLVLHTWRASCCRIRFGANLASPHSPSAHRGSLGPTHRLHLPI